MPLIPPTLSQVGITSDSNSVEYSLRFVEPYEYHNEGTSETESRWATKFDFQSFRRIAPRLAPGEHDAYVTSGFVFLQNLVDQAIIQRKSGSAVRYSAQELHVRSSCHTRFAFQEPPHVSSRFKQFPYPRYEEDPFLYLIRGVFPLFIVLSCAVLPLRELPCQGRAAHTPSQTCTLPPRSQSPLCTRRSTA